MPRYPPTSHPASLYKQASPPRSLRPITAHINSMGNGENGHVFVCGQKAAGMIDFPSLLEQQQRPIGASPRDRQKCQSATSGCTPRTATYRKKVGDAAHNAGDSGTPLAPRLLVDGCWAGDDVGQCASPASAKTSRINSPVRTIPTVLLFRPRCPRAGQGRPDREGRW